MSFSLSDYQYIFRLVSVHKRTKAGKDQKRNSGEGHLVFACPKREGQHKFDTTKRWVTINFTASQGEGHIFS